MTLPQRHPQLLDISLRPHAFARLFFAMATLLAVLPLPVVAESAERSLRVGLVRYLKGASALDVSCSVDFTITDEAGKRSTLTSTYLEPVSIAVNRDGLVIKKADGKNVTRCDRLRIVPQDPDGLLTISTPKRSFSQYRGVLEIRRVTDTAISVVNEVQLEDYLKGVLPAEMPSSFNLETLKAQAIAARTYSVRRRGKHSDSGYDLCDTDHCQVYTGSGAETPSTTRAVMETTGLVAKYDGKLIMAVYSADCGGQTQSGDDPAIAQPEPYLRSMPDCLERGKPDFCSVNKTHDWMKTFTPQELEAAMNVRLYPKLEGLKGVAFLGYDDSGRVMRVDVTDSKGTRKMTGAEFRRICGYSVIRSLRMTVSTDEVGKICFEGKGWGHGVGMCQWGAEGLAREPMKFTYEQILKHYYPGISIEKR